jgi:hypothetical protein
VPLVDECLSNLQLLFRDGLEHPCQLAAAAAAAAAPQTSQNFADGMHWQTYRATLYRFGSWRRDLNEELLSPMLQQIFGAWKKESLLLLKLLRYPELTAKQVFETDMFSPFQLKVKEAIKQLLKDIRASASANLVGRVDELENATFERARITLEQSIARVQAIVSEEQKTITRSLIPHIQAKLIPTYRTASSQRGKGSVAVQKVCSEKLREQTILIVVCRTLYKVG